MQGHYVMHLMQQEERREEGIEEWRPGVNPFLGRGIRPAVPRFIHWERVPGNSNNINVAQGRSRLFPAPHSQISKDNTIANHAV